MGRKTNATLIAEATAELQQQAAQLRKSNEYLTTEVAKLAGDERGVRAGFDVVCKALSAERAKVAVLTQQNEQLQGQLHAMLPKPAVKRAYKRRDPDVYRYSKAAPPAKRAYKRRGTAKKTKGGRRGAHA